MVQLTKLLCKLRISWAFLEIHGTEPTLSDGSVAIALGRILATVEHSLHRWERGECQSHLQDKDDSLSLGNDASVFSSFFGKPRLNLPLLEQVVTDQDDEDESLLATILDATRRPMLQDLSIDPSTLCKAACAFQRLSAKHRHINAGWTLTRVAVRLLSSKDARLMRECSINDIVRLCEATVLNDVDGHGRELITGLFARKVVQVLNDALDKGGDGGADSSINVASASPYEISTLLWALGELGAKHSLSDEARHSAYKKMRLVSAVPLLTKDEVKLLDASAVIKLVSIEH
jgi:hypothetical protein